MPKMKLDQKQPAKLNKKSQTQRKQAKLLKEQAKYKELQKQFPKLFSPQKVKNIEDRQKQLVQSSLKKEVCPEENRRDDVLLQSDDQENMPENTTNRQPFVTSSTTPLTDTLPKKTPLRAAAAEAVSSNSKRVLQVLASPSPVPHGHHNTLDSSSSRVSLLPGCSCSVPVTGAEGIDDGDVENQHCDICVQIAPLANTRKDVVHALRNFLNKPVPTETVMTDEKEEEKVEENVEEEVLATAVALQEEEGLEEGQEESISSGQTNNLFGDLDQEMPRTHTDSEEEEENEDRDQDSDEDHSPVFDEEIIDVKSESDINTKTDDSSAITYDCFNETLLSSLADGRMRGRVVGRKVMSDHVEFIFKIQVLKEGYTFQEIHDEEYLVDCMSPSSHVTEKKESPYVIQMCILRRYSDFEKLQEKLILASKKVNVEAGILQTKFPAKQYFRSFGLVYCCILY